MFAKTLIKLVDYAIFPAILIVAAKVIGIVFLSRYFAADFRVDGIQLVFDNYENFIAINSYSSLFAFACVVGGLLWVTVKAHVFHDTHVTPKLSAQLYNMNLEELIHSSQTIFSQAFIWLSYAWLTTVMFGVQSYFGLSYWWVFYIGLAVSVLATVLLVLDVEKEMVHDKKVIIEDKPSKVVTLREVKKEVLI